MTVDEANTFLAIASNKESRLNAYRLLSAAAARAAHELDRDLHPDESDGYALISRIVEASNTLTQAAHWLAETGDRHGHRAIDELDQAQVHIQHAIQAL